MVHPSLSYKRMVTLQDSISQTYDSIYSLTITEYLLGEKGMIKEEKKQCEREVKLTVQPKMKFLSSLNHPHIFPNVCNILSPIEHNRKDFRLWNFGLFCYCKSWNICHICQVIWITFCFVSILKYERFIPYIVISCKNNMEIVFKI